MNSGILRLAQDLVSAGDVTGERKRRNQHGDRPEDGHARPDTIA